MTSRIADIGMLLLIQRRPFFKPLVLRLRSLLAFKTNGAFLMRLDAIAAQAHWRSRISTWQIALVACGLHDNAVTVPRHKMNFYKVSFGETGDLAKLSDGGHGSYTGSASGCYAVLAAAAYS